MDPIPWYQSKILRGLIAAAVLYGLQLLKLGGDDAQVQQIVDIVLRALEFGSLAYSAWHRVKSPTPAIAGTAQAKNVPPVLAAISVMMFALPLLGGCASLGLAKDQTVEQGGAALLGDFTLYQKASLEVGNDVRVVPEVRKAVLDAAIAAKPGADSLDSALMQYRAVKRELDAGTTTNDKLQIAAANLSSWIQKVTPLVTQLRTLVEGAHAQ